MMAESKMSSQKETFARDLDCKRCKNALKFKTVREFDDEIFDELYHSSYFKTNQDDRDILLPIFQKKLENIAMRKVILPIDMNDVSSGDFMVVGDITSLPLDNSQSFKITDALCNLISDNTSIDHPVCEECTDNILDQMDNQLKKSEEEYKMYENFLINYKEPELENIEELEAELNQLKAAEAKLEEELLECEAKKAAVKEALKPYEEKAEFIEKKGKKQWKEYCSLKHEMLSMEDSKRSVNYQLEYAQNQLDKLSRTNVFSDTFHIWHSGHFGTINNFRLGRLPKEPVEWPEINAAWGQTVLLLHCLARKINLTFERYRLVPYGNNSYIVPIDSKTDNLPLYCLGGIKYVLDHRFDLAMVAFLDCLQQFKEKVEAGDHSFHLPYRMDKGKIEDKNARKSYSVKIHLNSQEQWTKALKFMLTNLKWALAWVSTQFQDDN